MHGGGYAVCARAGDSHAAPTARPPGTMAPACCLLAGLTTLTGLLLHQGDTLSDRVEPSLRVSPWLHVELAPSAAAAGGSFPLGRQRWGVNVHFNWRQCCRDTCANHSRCDMHAAADMPMLAPAFGSARMDLSWSHVERERGVYDWEGSGYQSYVQQLLEAEVVPYMILSYGNSLYDNACAPADKHDGTCPPTTDAGREGFANFTLAAMRKFQGRGIIWEIWNEPDGGTWLPHTTPPGQDYARLVLAVGAARDAAGLRDELLIGPATSGVDMAFIDTVGRAGCFAFLDGLSVHPYRSGGPESVLESWDQLNVLIDKYYVPASANGTRRPKVVSGEWGWASCADGQGRAVSCTSGGGVGMAVTRSEQAARLVRQRYINDLAGVAHSIYYDWQDDGPDAFPSLDSEFNFGTTLSSSSETNGSFVGRPKPAYTAALASSRILGNCSFDERLSSSSPGSFALAYACPGSAVGSATTRGRTQTLHTTGARAADGRAAAAAVVGVSSGIGADVLVLTVWDPTLYNSSAVDGAVSPGKVSTVTVPPSEVGRCFDALDIHGDRVTKQQRICAAKDAKLSIELQSAPQYLIPVATAGGGKGQL